MDSLEKRLQSYEPLWGCWRIGTRLYRNAACSIFALDGGQVDGFPCVVKAITILGSGGALAERLAEAREEIEALRRFRDCGNVVTLYDEARFPILDEDGEAAGWDILLRMERLDCLAELLREGEGLSGAKIRTLARDIASALSAVHGAGLIHRDVKPGNIYRTPGGRFQLGDFGIARKSRAGVLETMAGTAAYLAPETARGGAYDSRADLYSLGIVLYQLLNRGQLPLSSEASTCDQRETAIRRRWDGARLPLPPGGDRRLKRLVRKLCQADPRRRFHSAEAFLKALEGGGRFLPLAALSGWLCAAAALTALLAVLIAPPVEPNPLSAEQDAPPAVVMDDPPPAVEDLPEPSAGTERRYAVIRASMRWEDARIYCEARGGHLAVVLDQEQMDEITALLEAEGIGVAWLGADNRNPSGGFQWITGEPFQFAAWGIGEPNNSGGEEHFLMLYKKEGQGWVWNDSRDGGMENFEQAGCGFVCQWDGDG